MQDLAIELAAPPKRKWRSVAARDAACDLKFVESGVLDAREFHPACFPRRGWVFTVMRRGQAVLNTPGSLRRLQPLDAVIVHPSQSSIRIEVRSEPTEMLTWVWGSDPRIEPCRAPPGGVICFSLRNGALHRLEKLHAACRKELLSPDELTPQALESVRLELEVTLARERNRADEIDVAPLLLERALRWMETHQPCAGSVATLCCQLQISPMTLHRAFRRQLSASPAGHHRRLWMRKAERMLADGKSVKEVAFSLGYRFANDFSRAFAKTIGHPPGKRQEAAARGRTPRENGTGLGY